MWHDKGHILSPCGMFMCASSDAHPLLCHLCRYGLGQILIKQEKHTDALGHFELACRINPASSVLRCCCGLALHKMGRLDEATRQLRVRAPCLHRRDGKSRLQHCLWLVAVHSC